MPFCISPTAEVFERPLLKYIMFRIVLFAKLREQNSGGPRFSFVDGPVTANRFSLGVHTAWGRTLKDVFQRYKALRGFDQRYQNGFFFFSSRRRHTRCGRDWSSDVCSSD